MPLKVQCCNLKTTELLDCALIRACAVIRLNMVYLIFHDTRNTMYILMKKKTTSYHIYHKNWGRQA